MIKRLSVYFLCFWISFFPVYQAHAFAPAVAVGLGSNAVRFLASEIALDVIARGFASNDPLYKTQGKLPRAKYLSFLKGKGKLVPFIAHGLAAAGFSIIGDDIVINPQVDPVPEGDLAPQKGVAWRSGSIIGETVTSAASKKCESYQYCTDFDIEPYRYDPARQDLRTVKFKLESGAIWITEDYQSVVCHTLTPAQQLLVPTCAASWQPSNPEQRPATDKEIDTDFPLWVSSQPEHDQRFAFGDENGALHPDLKPDIQVPPPPTMPDGSPIPGVGEQLWIYADWIARGVGQNADPSVDHYIPPQVWDDAYFLAHSVAGSSSAITSANANGSSIPNPNPDGNTNPDGNWSVSNPLPVIGPMTFKEYQTYTDNNYSQASDSLGDSDLQTSKDEITTAMNDFIDNSVSVDIPDFDFNPFGYMSFGGGHCIPFTVDLSIGTLDKKVVFDSHCPPYEEYVRPTLEWSIYLMTALNIYMIFTRTVRSI
ncbi:hypothetical protein E8L98_08385 [Vibrio cholerae]|nr:hypothetical protein [Vibrio cholerae]